MSGLEQSVNACWLAFTCLSWFHVELDCTWSSSPRHKWCEKSVIILRARMQSNFFFSRTFIFFRLINWQYVIVDYLCLDNNIHVKYTQSLFQVFCNGSSRSWKRGPSASPNMLSFWSRRAVLHMLLYAIADHAQLHYADYTSTSLSFGFQVRLDAR